MVLQHTRAARELSFPSRYERVSERALKPGRLAGLLARARAGALNEALVAGCDPAVSRVLAARALQLTSARSRASLAEGLDRLLRSAQAAPSRWRVRPQRDAVCANASALGELASLLASASPLYARGVAALELLLSDGTGAAYRGDGEALASRLEECRAAMTGAD
jgi:hypothetical protein